jgi:hypothetical protein
MVTTRMTPLSLTRSGIRLAACLGALWTARLVAAETGGGFSATLSDGLKAAAGLATLNADELKALDQQVADDLTFAREEKLTALDGTFAARRTEAQRKQAGLDRLTPDQLARLNELVAAALAARPAPKERPRLKESEVLAKNRPEIHGSVSVTYGWGRGGQDFRGSSLWLEYYDPESRFALGVGVSNFSGSGYYPGYYYPGYSYGPGYYYDPGYAYPAAPRPYLDASYRGDALEAGAFVGDGSCFRGSPGGGFGERGRRH